jgi:hypothetical protein
MRDRCPLELIEIGPLNMRRVIAVLVDVGLLNLLFWGAIIGTNGLSKKKRARLRCWTRWREQWQGILEEKEGCPGDVESLGMASSSYERRGVCFS